MRTSYARSTALACLAALPCCGLTAEHVVLESNTPAYVPGQTFDAEATVILEAQQFIVIASDDGRLMRVTGPHAGPAAGPPPAADTLGEVLGRLLGRQAPELGGLAGVRGVGDQPAASEAADSRADPWSIHSAQTGDQCFVAGRPLQVWRESAGAAAAAEVTNVADGASARIEWPSGQALASWPAPLATIDEGIYLLRLEAALRSVAIRLHALEPTILDRGLVTVAWLAAKGCTPQARLLLRDGGVGTAD